MMETQEQVLLRWNQWVQRVVRLTSAGRGRLPPSGRTWFVSQIWALLSTSWTWWNHAQLISVRKTFRCERWIAQIYRRMDKLFAPMSWQPCWIPAMRYGTNLCMEPLSCTDPDTPWATFTRSPSLEWQGTYVFVKVRFYELMTVKRTSTWSSASGYYFSPWHPGSPFLCTFSDARHQKKSIPLELQWSPPARSPSWLGGGEKDTSWRNQKQRFEQKMMIILLYL